jgi:hypothetical protein
MGDRDWYLQGVDRLVGSLQRTGWTGDKIARKKVPAGCPDPKAVRCAFKYYLMHEMAEKGYTQILWLDSSMWAVRSIEPIFERIATDGYYLVQQGWNTGQWCADSALAPLGITREESFDIPQLVGGISGVNLEHDLGRQFYEEMWRLAREKTAFIGPRSKSQGFCSNDPRVLGHRSDQTCASVVAHKLGMKGDVHTKSLLKFTYGWKGQAGNHWKVADVPPPKCILVRGGVRPHDLNHIPYPA